MSRATAALRDELIRGGHTCGDSVLALSADLEPWGGLIDEAIPVNMEQRFSCGQIRIFAKRVCGPGKIGPAEKIAVVAAGDDLIENPGMAAAEDKLAPDLHYVHIGVYED